MKYLDLGDLRDDGYLQEVNRQFFHPLGLALAIIAPTVAGEQPAFLTVIDSRDDPEGMIFAPTDLAEKALKLEEISRLRYAARVNALGYWVQPTESRK